MWPQSTLVPVFWDHLNVNHSAAVFHPKRSIKQAQVTYSVIIICVEKTTHTLRSISPAMFYCHPWTWNVFGIILYNKSFYVSIRFSSYHLFLIITYIDYMHIQSLKNVRISRIAPPIYLAYYLVPTKRVNRTKMNWFSNLVVCSLMLVNSMNTMLLPILLLCSGVHLYIIIYHVYAPWSRVWSEERPTSESLGAETPSKNGSSRLPHSAWQRTPARRSTEQHIITPQAKRVDRYIHAWPSRPRKRHLAWRFRRSFGVHFCVCLLCFEEN